VRLESYPARPENTYLEVGRRTNGTGDSTHQVRDKAELKHLQLDRIFHDPLWVDILADDVAFPSLLTINRYSYKSI
jgi:hypothetical protein